MRQRFKLLAAKLIADPFDRLDPNKKQLIVRPVQELHEDSNAVCRVVGSGEYLIPGANKSVRGQSGEHPQTCVLGNSVKHV